MVKLTDKIVGVFELFEQRLERASNWIEYNENSIAKSIAITTIGLGLLGAGLAYKIGINPEMIRKTYLEARK